MANNAGARAEPRLTQRFFRSQSYFRGLRDGPYSGVALGDGTSGADGSARSAMYGHHGWQPTSAAANGAMSFRSLGPPHADTPIRFNGRSPHSPCSPPTLDYNTPNLKNHVYGKGTSAVPIRLEGFRLKT